MYVLFLVADEQTNAGERDYLLAFSHALKNKQGVECSVRKVLQQDFDRPVLDGDSASLPLDNMEYENIRPYVLGEMIDNIIDVRKAGNKVLVIGAGQSVIPQISELYHTFGSFSSVQFAVVSHMLEERDIAHLAGKKIEVFTKAQEVEADISHHFISNVPHTATAEGAEQNAVNMLKYSPHAGKLVDIFNGQSPYAIAVLNAGFKVNDVHIPYYEDEAYEHGMALGQSLPANTSLILVDGGPRNLTDRNDYKQLTHESFRNGFMEGAASLDGAGREFVHEAFEFGLPYNSVLGTMHFANAKNCVAYISNAEGYGTMDAVFRIVKLAPGRLIGMIPFSANEKDETGQRLENIEDYRKRGITKLVPGDCGFVRHLPPSKIQSDFEKPAYDAVSEILRTLDVPGFELKSPVQGTGRVTAPTQG